MSKNSALVEHAFVCPYCWEEITVLLDSSAAEQTYVEDCEVCCNPIALTVRWDEDGALEFEAVSLEQ